MISAQYKSPISNSMIVCDLVNEEHESFWIYRDNGKRLSCSTNGDQAEALDWFFKVYMGLKPVYTL